MTVPAAPSVNKILFYGATAEAETDESGTASLDIQIPGTFSGLSGFTGTSSEGRYVKKFQLWTENGATGDLVNNIRLEDRDGVLGAASGFFPSYPVVQYLQDQDISVGATGGLSVPSGQVIEISPIDQIDNRGIMFAPAQIYLCMDYIAGDGASGRALKMNLIWGKYFP